MQVKDELRKLKNWKILKSSWQLSQVGLTGHRCREGAAWGKRGRTVQSVLVRWCVGSRALRQDPPEPGISWSDF